MGFKQKHHIPDLGVGVGYRSKHFDHVLENQPPMDWFEIIGENYMTSPRPVANLERLRETYRVIVHGVSLSIGSVDPLDEAYLARLRELVERVKPPWLSDHLCWTGAHSLDLHDLLPMPYTREALAHVVERVKRVQDRVRAPFALENVSSYLTFKESVMPEWEFLSEIAERADCGILLDVNNIYVSAYNHGFDANAYVDAIPADRVVQIHLAGHTDKGGYLLDTHSDHVKDEVWELYRRALRRVGPTSTLVEWDEDIPEWDVLAAEAERARRVKKETLAL